MNLQNAVGCDMLNILIKCNPVLYIKKEIIHFFLPGKSPIFTVPINVSPSNCPLPRLSIGDVPLLTGVKWTNTCNGLLPRKVAF